MKRCSSMANRLLRASFGLAIILVVLLALLPAKKLITVETSSLRNQVQAEDTSDSVALVSCVDDPLFSGEPAYLVPDAAVPFGESFVVYVYPYRGPPALS